MTRVIDPVEKYSGLYLEKLEIPLVLKKNHAFQRFF